MCCNSGEDLEVFAPYDNLPHKYTRWNLKISCNFCLFVFFQQGSRHFSFLEEVLKIARQAQNRGREKGGGGEEEEKRAKGKGRGSPFPSLPPLSKPAAQVRSGCLA